LQPLPGAAERDRRNPGPVLAGHRYPLPTSPRFPTRALTRPSGPPLWRLALVQHQ